MPPVLPAAPASRPAGAPWSLADAAAFLGVSLTVVERQIRFGHIRSFKLGSRRLIADAELKRVAAGD